MAQDNAARITAHDVATDMRKTVIDTGVFAQEAFTEGKEKVKQLRETSETYIRENPWRSVLGTLAIGLVLGVFIGSRRRT